MRIMNMRQPDFVITDPPEVVAEKILLATERNKLPAGMPSGTDLLLEERRLERERELAEEGW
ncbi:MAG: hypothetical protein ABSC62_12795 [Terracidiphilus sp.]|jgi:hypothetical protein